MNFLAHLYLSGQDTGILIGNFIADGVRGKELDIYPKHIRDGIVIHRKIDTYTDSHPIVKQTVHKLRNSSGKYAPVVSDVIYDHFLAHNWKNYSNIPLEQFARDKYALLKQNKNFVPDRMQDVLSSMIRQDWLVHYAQLTGIAKTLKNMSKRVHFANNIGSAIKDLELYYSLFQNDFEEFFPQLQQYVSQEMQKLNYTLLVK